jgi:hypothetical protein
MGAHYQARRRLQEPTWGRKELLWRLLREEPASNCDRPTPESRLRLQQGYMPIRPTLAEL